MGFEDHGVDASRVPAGDAMCSGNNQVEGRRPPRGPGARRRLAAMLVPQKKECQTLDATKAGKRAEDARRKELEQKGTVSRYRDVSGLERAVQQKRLVKVTDTQYYDVDFYPNENKSGIGERDPEHKYSYAVLTPQTKQLLDDFASAYFRHFSDRGITPPKLRITSLTRTLKYNECLKKGTNVQGQRRWNRNNNVSDTSSHMYGCTFDVALAGLRGEFRTWVQQELSRLACAGHVRAVKEGNEGSAVFHVMNRHIGNPYGRGGRASAQPPARPKSVPPTAPSVPTAPSAPPSVLPSVPRPPAPRSGLPSSVESGGRGAPKEGQEITSLRYVPAGKNLKAAITGAARFAGITLAEAERTTFTRKIERVLKAYYPRSQPEATIKSTDEVAIGRNARGVFAAFRRQGKKSIEIKPIR